ncbi:cyclase family protein [Arthrobacter sp. YC-RL1]|uniref:cyclase family protein n=1 Tax=Arthrobacter sp. YC-RL1 TaxID=1652545 RepID=UPI00128C953C|nr:cyclase family protein [Arthrobacter sp. YC-RL1]
MRQAPHATAGSPAEEMDRSYTGRGSDSPQWWPSRYGEGDELGAGNELSPELTLAALQLVREGRIVELARVLEPTIPIWQSDDDFNGDSEWSGARIFHQVTLGHNQMEAMVPEGNKLGFFEEQITQLYHVGTHMDGLSHVGIDGRYYNGVHYKDMYTSVGMKKMGIQNVKPWVSRGVLLNIAAVLGVEKLEPGFVIKPEHLEAASEAQDVEVRAGDVVLLHTGHGALWKVDNDAYHFPSPGIGWDAAHWLTDRRVSAIGADNWGVEVLPGENPDLPFVVHQHTLAETGTYLFENFKTDELAESGRSEFLFICTPIKTRGSTSSMLAPVAVL